MSQAHEILESDVLVVGGGLAGTLAAIAAKERLGSEGKVVVADKGKVGRSGQSAFAAGIFTAFDPEQDKMDVWMDEIVNWGEFLNDQAWCKLMFENGLRVLKGIDRWGAEKGLTVFERDSDGRLLRRRSRGHLNTMHYVVNSLPMMDTLTRKMRERQVITLNRLMVTDLVTVEGKITGAVGFDYTTNRTYYLRAKTVILCASGCGFRSVFMGHRNLTGDLLAAAYDAGVTFRNMEQYASNTTAKNYDIHGLNLYVGVGGRFLNAKGEEFMWQYHPVLGNRARLQDLVLSFCREIKEGRGPIYLDMSAASLADRALCRKILPESFRLWDRAGIDPFQQPVEWIPAFYGTITSGGGIHINTRCETNIPHLYAAGDITPEPPHGTYSFGGINLGFTAVSGWEAGSNAGSEAQSIQASTIDKQERARARDILRNRMQNLMRADGISGDDLTKAIQQAIIPVDSGYFKTEARLAESWQALEEITEKLTSLRAGSAHELVRVTELESMTKVARLMVAAARARTESRGYHFREDYPFTDNENWLRWVTITNVDNELKIDTQQVPTPYVQPKEKRSIPPGIKRASSPGA